MKTDVKPEAPETEQEILSPMADMLDNQTLAVIQKSEIDMQISTAKKYPRQLTRFLNTATQLATQDPESADECVYALPRDGKTIEGPSARFAEIIAYSWGNCRAGARVIGEDEEFVTAMGTFADLEQNVSIGYEVRRRITNREGKRYNLDMISTTANAACSIALRNAVLKGVPKAIWKKIYDRARQTIAGDIKTLDSRRAAAMKQFQLMGAKPEQILALLDVKGVDDITLDHLVILRGIYNAIKEGETTVARAFAPPDTQDKNLAAKTEKNVEDIKKKYATAKKQFEEAQAEFLADAKKSGAGQPPASTSGNGDVAATAAAAETPASGTAAPPDQQSPDDSQSSPRGTAAEPEGHPGDGPSELQSQQPVPQSQELHGVAGLFETPAPTKRKR